MHVTTARFLGVSLALWPFFAFASPLQRGSDEKSITKEQQEQIRDNYLALWGGDYTLSDKVLSSGVTLNIDRHPTANGSVPVIVNNSKEFMDFLKWSRTGWEKFAFKVVHWAADGHNIAIRWKLEAVMGEDYSAPTRAAADDQHCARGSTLKPGDHVTYNGTDFLVLNKCTGLVDEVNIAQDIMNLFHALGMTSVPV